MTLNINESLSHLGPTQKQKMMSRVLPFVVMGIVLVVIPLFEPSRSTYSLLNVMGINIVFALSYNMMLGQTGLLSFGHAVYFGLGGFGAMHAMNWIESAANGGGFWASFPIFGLPFIGFAFGALAGAVIGWPSCRRAGIPFAMITLGIAELIASAGFMFTSIFGGEEGITGDRMNGISVFGLSLGPINEVYVFIAFWTMLASILMFAFTRTPLGRIAQAVRDNGQRVEFVGYDPQHVRYLVFTIAGGFSGMAGGMAAVNYEIFTPESLSLSLSGMVLLMAFIGGIRYFFGPILGAILLTFMQSNLSDYTEGWLLYLGVLFISVVMFAPGGLAGVVVGLFKGSMQKGASEYLKRWAGMSASCFVGLLGGVLIIELTIRLTNGYGETFPLFGSDLSPVSPVGWAIGLFLLSAGFASLKWISNKGDAA